MNVQDFVSIHEDVAPLSAHTTTFDSWASQLTSSWEDHGMVQIPDLEGLLEFREDLLVAAVEQVASDTSAPDWQWLLTAPQVEQRTPAWYLQAKTVLTASEIGELFKGPRSLGVLVESKSKFTSESTFTGPSRLAVSRAETKATDWGIRYEPVVKQYLEESLACRIHELGRICHRDPTKRVAASPDGLIVEGPLELTGRLVEIKCPLSREIKFEIPVDYWRQMQLQLECCGLQACEYVEAKFKERSLDEPVSKGCIASGYITLIQDSETLENRYIYARSLDSPSELLPSWSILETYMWDLVHLRRTTVPKDTTWFASLDPHLTQFWTNVEACRNGTWNAPPPRAKKEKVLADRCAIQESDDEVPVLPVETSQETS